MCCRPAPRSPVERSRRACGTVETASGHLAATLARRGGPKPTALGRRRGRECANITAMRVCVRTAAAALTATLVVGIPAAAPRAADRPTVAGRNGAVSAGHPLTSAAAFEVLLKGGNAFDAGVAAMLVGGVVEQDLYSLGGEGLVLVYSQRERKVTSIVGQGWAPKGATIDWYTSRGKNLNGIGLDPAVVPGTVHAALTVLERWGTMTFEQVSMRAIEYAARGFPLRPRTAAAIDSNRKFIDAWPDNQRTWLKPDGTA